MGRSRGTGARRRARRGIGIGVGVAVAAALLTGCGSSADAEAARTAVVAAVTDLPDVADVAARIHEDRSGVLETRYETQVDVTMAAGAPLASYARVADAAVQATRGSTPADLWLEDSVGGTLRFDTDAPAETVDATVTAWRDWSRDAASADVQLIVNPALENRPLSTMLDVAISSNEPLTPTNIARFVGGFQADFPEPLASAKTSLGLVEAQPYSPVAPFFASDLPVPPTALETISSIEGTTAILEPLGGTVRTIEWYGKDRRWGKPGVEQLSLSFDFATNPSLALATFEELEASPQWAAYQEITRLANQSTVTITFNLVADGRLVASLAAGPCGSADDDRGPRRRTGEADTAISAWWLAQAPACTGVGRHE